jgi:hypothetical protein
MGMDGWISTYATGGDRKGKSRENELFIRVVARINYGS